MDRKCKLLLEFMPVLIYTIAIVAVRCVCLLQYAYYLYVLFYVSILFSVTVSKEHL